MTTVPALAAALRSERFAHTSLADGTGVILDIVGEQVLTLNNSSEFLVSEILAGAPSEADLVQRMMAKFEVGATLAQADVAAFLAKLREHVSPA